MKDIKVLGMDLAKDVFQIHGTEPMGSDWIDFHCFKIFS